MDLSGVKSTLLKMGHTGYEIKCLYGIIKCLYGKNENSMSNNFRQIRFRNA